MQRNGRTIGVIVVLAVIAGGAWWVFGRGGAGDESARKASGTIEATTIDIAPEIGGRVVAVEVEEGDEVAAGDVLVTLDGALIEAQLAQAEAAVAAARAGGAGPQVAAAEAALRVVTVQQDKLTLRAPTDGVVLTRAIEPGEVAMPGAPLLLVGKPDALWITVYVAEDRLGGIDVGDEAEVRADAYPRDVFDGTVAHIDDKAQFTPRNVQTAAGRKATVYGVRLDVANKRDRLKPGMPADVTFDE